MKYQEECSKYWTHRHSISVQNNLLIKDSKIIIPSKLREDILNRVHDGHLGISKFRARARESVYWPGLSSEIENLDSKCHKCIQHQKYFKEPLLPSRTSLEGVLISKRKNVSETKHRLSSR